MSFVPTRRGFIIADIIVGLGILGLVGMVLSVALTREYVAEHQLADTRQATRVAEAVLSNLQAGLPSPAQEQDTQIAIQPCEASPAVPGHTWVKIVVHVRGQSHMITGLVPTTDGIRATPAGSAR